MEEGVGDRICLLQELSLPEPMTSSYHFHDYGYLWNVLATWQIGSKGGLLEEFGSILMFQFIPSIHV